MSTAIIPQDYEGKFASTVRFESVRALVAMAARVGWELDQMDVTTAFLYAELEEETYVEIPEGVAQVGEGDMVWRLWKCLYGLPHECGIRPSTNF